MGRCRTCDALIADLGRIRNYDRAFFQKYGILLEYRIFLRVIDEDSYLKLLLAPFHEILIFWSVMRMELKSLQQCRVVFILFVD